MKIGLIAEDSKLPNYALMKIYAYHKSIGDDVDFALPFRNPYSINEIPQWQKDMARWAMRREYYKASDFKDFEIRKNFKCINHFNN